MTAGRNMRIADAPEVDRLPRALDAEDAFLGRALIGGADLELPGGLHPLHFSGENRPLIFGAIRALRREGLPSEAPAVQDHLRKAGKLTATITAEIGRMIDLAGSEAMLPYYAARILQDHNRRHGAKIAESIRVALLEPHNGDTPDHLAHTPRLARKLARLTEAAAGTATGSAELKAIDIEATLTAADEPIPWSVKPWLAERDLVVLAGPPKMLKSFVAMDLSLSLVTGTPWLGCVKVARPYRVLILDEENNGRLLRYRLRRLTKGRELTAADLPPDRFRCLAENALTFANPDKAAALRSEVARFRPDWIILDTLIRFSRGVDENDNSEMAALFADIKELASISGAGVILLHHVRKPSINAGPDLASRVRGASDIVASADQLWVIEPDSRGGLVLRHERSRWAEAGGSLTLAVKDLPYADAIRIEADDVEAQAASLIMDHLIRAGEAGCPRPEIVALLEEGGDRNADRTASRHLARMHRTGRIKKRAAGRTMNYWAFGYSPPEAE